MSFFEAENSPGIFVAVGVKSILHNIRLMHELTQQSRVHEMSLRSPEGIKASLYEASESGPCLQKKEKRSHCTIDVK